MPDLPPGALSSTVFRYIRPRGPEAVRESSFHSEVLHADERLLILAHRLYPANPIVVGGEAVLEAGDLGIWFLQKGETYDIARVYDDEKRFKGYYVDMLRPVAWNDSDADSLEPLVDLFLDLWITPEGDFTILDEDEFEEACHLEWITSADCQSARSTLSSLIESLQAGQFPPEVVRAFNV